MSGNPSTAAGVPRRVHIDKIASSTIRGRVPARVDLGQSIPAREGAVVVGRVLNSKTAYNTLEDVHGRMRLVNAGDIVCGVLGHRNALHGYVGHVPENVSVGDELNILNLGGVIGECTNFNPDVGKPFRLEILGAVMHYPDFGQRTPLALTIPRDPDLADTTMPEALPPVALMVGTSMNAGKTTAICELVRHFKRKGKRVAAAKCTGVSLLRDVLEMRDFGALHAESFVDLGVVTTGRKDAVPVTRALIRRLASQGPDVIVLELGDGILGTYGVAEILSDEAIRSTLCSTILCATDPVSSWGGVKLLQERFGITPDCITGPVSDNSGGTAAVREEFGVVAHNARREGEALADCVLEAIASNDKQQKEHQQ